MNGLDKDDFDRQYGDSVLLKRITSYFSPYKLLIIILSICLFLSSLASTIVPVLISETLDNYSTSNLQDLILLLLGFSVFSFVMNLLQQEFTYRATSSAVYDLRSDAFDSLLAKDMAFYDKQPSGRLASRVVNDSNDFGQTVSLVSNLIGQLLIIVFLIYFLLIKSVKLTVVILLFGPLIIIVALSFRKIARTVALASQRILAKVNALIQESTSGIYIAKSFRAEQSIYDEFNTMNNTSYDVNLKRGLVFNSIFPILGFLTAIGVALIVFFGGKDLIGSDMNIFGLIIPKEELTIGNFYLFITGLNLFFFPLLQIASFWSQFQQGLAASERIFGLIDAENNVIQYDSKIIMNPQGGVEFKNLIFAYKPGQNIFENFNLKVSPGEKVAIVGHTGAGKSSLAKLISRAYEFQQGEIFIDGYDIRSLDLDAYRKNLAIITQEVFLWNESIKSNLLYGLNVDSTEADTKLQTVLTKVSVLDWINSLEKGLETKIGERGSKLSMGQRQLISFARILLQNPSILIMDEATASVDPLTELNIQHATDVLMEGRTSIIIAHRLSTIKKADRIIVLDKGKVVEEGNHETLLSLNGYYADLYNTYYRHQSLQYIESMAK
jgi:ABC-type multidrug transport system fused ATPase/permease subunit